jgi:carnitine O-acetyltransferase
VQVGTCTHRWYDKVSHRSRSLLVSDPFCFFFQFKLRIIVCTDDAAGINFEHTGVDGHTVLRYIPAASTVFSYMLILPSGLPLMSSLKV